MIHSKNRQLQILSIRCTERKVLSKIILIYVDQFNTNKEINKEIDLSHHLIKVILKK